MRDDFVELRCIAIVIVLDDLHSAVQALTMSRSFWMKMHLDTSVFRRGLT
jgi:hypothetical protein